MKTKDGADKKVKCSANTKIFSETWNSMTVQQKSKYHKMTAVDAERYKDQIDQIRKNGYFMTEDGIKSTDLPEKKKKNKK